MDRELLYRFFNGTASELERISIRKWAEAAPENMQELLKERKLYTAIILTGEREAFTSSKAPVGYKRSYFVRWGQYAAVFLCAVLRYCTPIGVFSITQCGGKNKGEGVTPGPAGCPGRSIRSCRCPRSSSRSGPGRG